MRRGVTKCGVLSKRELKTLPGLPSEERLKKGPVAVIECNQEIPCNPCVAACPREAIKVKALTSLPELDEDRCNGCGSCIAPCPGLAIFVVDMSYSEREAVVMLPYEFLPYPKVGERGNALDRAGRRACAGRVLKVKRSRRDDLTAVVSVVVPKRYAMEVRAIGHRR